MKYIIPILLLISIISILTGCSQDKGSSGTYPSAVAWNNNIYGLSVTEVPVKDIGKEIGKIERKTDPMPQQNGDSNDTPVGSLLFEVKGIDPLEELAIKVNDKYLSASKLGPIE